jgi:hypothetical protein
MLNFHEAMLAFERPDGHNANNRCVQTIIHTDVKGSHPKTRNWETNAMTYTKRILMVLLLMMMVALPAVGETTDADTENNDWMVASQELTDEQTEAQRIDVAKGALESEPAEFEKPLPVSFSIDYTLVSDYIFRGINFSEYKGEGREKLNHQLSVGTEVDLGKFGRLGASFWWEWYAGQNDTAFGGNAPGDDKHLQEVDYVVYYGYTIDPIGLDWEIGYIFYHFPRARRAAKWAGQGDADFATTNELYTVFSWDDSILWRALGLKVADPILNPYFSINWDMDLAKGSSFYAFGMSHDFALGDFCQAPVIKDLTFGVSWEMGWDHNWLNKFTLDPAATSGNEGRGYASNSSHLDYMNWGFSLTYDLKSALNIPDKYCGDMYVTGFLNLSNAIAENFLNDEVYGGMSVGYSW